MSNYQSYGFLTMPIDFFFKLKDKKIPFIIGYVDGLVYLNTASGKSMNEEREDSSKLSFPTLTLLYK